MKKRFNTIYIIASFLVCIFLTSGFVTILPTLSHQFSGINYDKMDAEKSETEKEVEKSVKEYYHTHSINIIAANVVLIEKRKPKTYSDKCIQLFIRNILTPPPEKDCNS